MIIHLFCIGLISFLLSILFLLCDLQLAYLCLQIQFYFYYVTCNRSCYVLLILFYFYYQLSSIVFIIYSTLQLSGQVFNLLILLSKIFSGKAMLLKKHNVLPKKQKVLLFVTRYCGFSNIKLMCYII